MTVNHIHTINKLTIIQCDTGHYWIYEKLTGNESFPCKLVDCIFIQRQKYVHFKSNESFQAANIDQKSYFFKETRKEICVMLKQVYRLNTWLFELHKRNMNWIYWKPIISLKSCFILIFQNFGNLPMMVF